MALVNLGLQMHEIADWLPWMVIAVLQAFTAWMTARTHTVAIETQKQVQQTEINTNSMKDALVKATGEAAFAAGREGMRVESNKEAATLAKSMLGQSK